MIKADWTSRTFSSNSTGTGPVNIRGVLTAEPAFDERNEPEFLPRRGKVLLASWFTHKGSTNNLWRKLVERLLSIVITTPGERVLSMPSLDNLSLIHSNSVDSRIS